MVRRAGGSAEGRLTSEQLWNQTVAETA
jgi:hypothetical protein